MTTLLRVIPIVVWVLTLVLTFWLLIWHISWHPSCILTFWHHLDLLSDVLTFYLTYILTFYLAFYLTHILAINLAFYYNLRAVVSGIWSRELAPFVSRWRVFFQPRPSPDSGNKRQNFRCFTNYGDFLNFSGTSHFSRIFRERNHPFRFPVIKKSWVSQNCARSNACVANSIPSTMERPREAIDP